MSATKQEGANADAGIDLVAEMNLGLEQIAAHEGSLVEAVVPPGSALVGSTAREVNFRQRFRLVALALHRKGRNVREQIDAWIAKAKDGAWTTSKPAMPQGLTRAAPDGCNGMAGGQVAMVLGQVVTVLSMMPAAFGDMGLGFDPQDIDVEAVRQLLKEHNLDVARSLTGYRDGWWRMRVFW